MIPIGRPVRFLRVKLEPRRPRSTSAALPTLAVVVDVDSRWAPSSRTCRARPFCMCTHSLHAHAQTSRGTRHSEMGRWATRRWTVRALRAAPVWCGHVATFPQGPKSARHLVPIVGRRGSFVPAARGRQRSARRERGVKITGVNVGGADMVCQARFFLCVHGAHAVAAERPITHKPSTRWLRAAVGLRDRKWGR